MCKSLFGGDSPPPAPSYASPPPPQEILDVIDEVTGTKTASATDPATGKKIRLIQKLPLSPEDQKLQDEAGSLMDRAIGEMKRLSNYNPSQIVDFTPLVNTLNNLNQERTQDMQRLTQIPDFTNYVNEFKTMGQEILDREFNRYEMETQDSLNQMGYRNSTYNAQTQAALGGERERANQRLNVDALKYGNQLRREDLADRTNEYNLREATRMGRLSSAQGEFALRKDYAQSLEQQRQQALQHQQMLYNVGAGIKGAETAKQLRTMAPSMALAENQAANQAQYAHYNAEINRQNMQYNNQMQEFMNQPPSFGETLLNLGSTAGMAMATASPNTVAGAWGSKLFGPSPSNFAPTPNNIPANQVGGIRR